MAQATPDTALVPRAPLPLPPTLPSWHPLGHLLRFRSDALGLFMAGMARGDVVRIRAGTRTIIAAYHPDHVHHVLVHRAANYEKKTRGYVVLRELLGQGLLTSEGEVWRRQRRIAQPAFQQQRLAGFAPTMVRAAEDLADRWEEVAKRGETFDMAEVMGRLALRIAGETLFSMDISGESDAVGRALSEVLGGFIRGVTNPLSKLFPLTRYRHKRAMRTLDQVVRGIVARRRAEGGGGDDLLGLFMSARDPETGEAMSDERLRDEVLTMLLAGHETTANALAWTFYRLSQHPLVDARLGEELEAVLGGGPLQLQRQADLTWTDLVLRESLRLHPPAWVESRKAVEADELGGYRVPAGGFVFLSQYAIHRNPRLWSDPERFDPERFLPERQVCPDGSPRPKLAWFPFGAGQRKCIGENFAMMEAKILVALLARRYRFALAPGAVVAGDPSVTLRPRGGLPMRIARR